MEGKNLGECLSEAKKLSFGDVHKCDLCASTNLTLDTHVAQKKYKYYYVRCQDCGGTLNFGQQMENPDVFYLRQNKQKELDWKRFAKHDEIEETELPEELMP